MHMRRKPDLVKRFRSGESWLSLVQTTGLSPAEVLGLLYRSGALDDVPASDMRPALLLKEAVRRRTVRNRINQGGVCEQV